MRGRQCPAAHQNLWQVRPHDHLPGHTRVCPTQDSPRITAVAERAGYPMQLSHGHKGPIRYRSQGVGGPVRVRVCTKRGSMYGWLGPLKRLASGADRPRVGLPIRCAPGRCAVAGRSTGASGADRPGVGLPIGCATGRCAMVGRSTRGIRYWLKRHGAT